MKNRNNSKNQAPNQLLANIYIGSGRESSLVGYSFDLSRKYYLPWVC